MISQDEIQQAFAIELNLYKKKYKGENLLVGMILKNSTAFDFESYLRLRSPVTSEFPPPL